MSSPSFFQIAGNIKQQFAPFVIIPKAKINQPVSSSTKLNGASPQVFSYKTNTTQTDGGNMKIRFYPSSMDDAAIKDDISFKLLYAREKLYEPGSRSITVQDILNSIPGVQIREFLPDTRLDQCINLFTDMMSNLTKMFVSDDKNNTSGSSGSSQSATKDEEAGLFKKITTAAWYTMKYMVGATDPNLYDDLSFGTLTGIDFSSYQSSVYQNNKTYPGSFVMAFPYTMYYLLQSCVTTNIYEIPAAQTSKNILVSGGGMAGWTDGGDDFMSAGGFRISNLLGKIPVIGNLANMILGNIGINYMPWWNAPSGAKTKEPQVEIKFDLFNDSADAAMANFIFVNTIVPNNKWIQYNMFQHSSHIYDVKIEGINRLFACAGDFNVTYEGVLRDPPEKWINELINAHANECMDKTAFLTNVKNNRLIKIPDVYRVTLQFQSLLPANFNNYIFNYAENASHLTKYSKHSYDASAAAKALPNAMKAFSTRVANVWKAGDESVENNKKTEKTD